MIKKRKKIQPSVGADRLNSALSRWRNSKSCDRPPRRGHVGNIWTKTGFRLLIAAFLASDRSEDTEPPTNSFAINLLRLHETPVRPRRNLTIRRTSREKKSSKSETIRNVQKMKNKCPYLYRLPPPLSLCQLLYMSLSRSASTTDPTH